MDTEQREKTVMQLRAHLRARGPEVAELLEAINSRVYEDRVYRFYHQSFKVFHLQACTEQIVATLQSLLPDEPLNDGFMRIVREGTGREFSSQTHARWLEDTRPILEAFFHARFFLEMACRYGDAADEDEAHMPSGWAALLHLFDLR